MNRYPVESTLMDRDTGSVLAIEVMLTLPPKTVTVAKRVLRVK